MKYGIIAAGEGSRLAREGIAVPKPLVRIAGESLIDRLVGIFCKNGADEISIICNEEMATVKQHITEMTEKWKAEGRDVKLNLTVKSTPSSMHSFGELVEGFDGDEPFIVTTVDTVFCEDSFADYVGSFVATIEKDGCDGLMGVTNYIDDEKPLYVGVDADGSINGFYDEKHGGYISAGIYGLTPRCVLTLRRCIERGESRMRNFQRALIADGIRLKAFDMGKVMDIDHADDIAKAEEMLK